ncbi:uncharacterized protein SCHCODRAFT_02590387 [Schizophyllum commune H4-8]|nr:uncharacterized protein SCHCODRAFT_02590387 [Schizophyllum commune H4-8]KAI5886954.1 hypothetical protein SCHCODRAFT_02590387 [Schizophyllum commune H4-8]
MQQPSSQVSFPQSRAHLKRQASKPALVELSDTSSSDDEAAGNGSTAHSTSLFAPNKRIKVAAERKDDLPYNPTINSSDDGGRNAKTADSDVKNTPAGHVYRYKPLPKETYKRVEEAQPYGARCPITLMDNFMHLLQLAHLIPRAIELLTAQKIACVRGMSRDAFNSGTSANLLYLKPEIHAAMDAGLCMFVPPMPVLLAARYAMKNNGMPPPTLEGAEQNGINMHIKDTSENAAGYIHHEQLFEKNFHRLHRFLPLARWNRKHTIDRPVFYGSTSTPSGAFEHSNKFKVKHYRWPFTGDDDLPEVLLHNDPWCIIYNGHRALKKCSSAPRTPPRADDTSSAFHSGSESDSDSDTDGESVSGDAQSRSVSSKTSSENARADSEDTRSGSEDAQSGSEDAQDAAEDAHDALEDAQDVSILQDYFAKHLQLIVEIGQYIDDLELPSAFLQSPLKRLSDDEADGSELSSTEASIADSKSVRRKLFAEIEDLEY